MEFTVPISRQAKRNILDHLLMRLQSIEGDADLMSFLNRVWPLAEMPSEDGRFATADGDIHKHMVMNDDWTIEELYVRRLRLLDGADEIFERFLNALVHPLVRRDATERVKAAHDINQFLVQDGYRFVQTGEPDNPLFELTGGGGKYEIVQRPYVEQVANVLRAYGVSCFYDNYEVHSLWGKNLVEHLQEVYGGTARYCLMFISEAYAQKVWPTHERRSAFDAAMQRRVEYILPVRFDNTVVPGLSPSVHYLNATDYPPADLAMVVLRKMGRIQ